MNSSLVMNIRKAFPALTQKIRGRDLIYLDSAATTLKPQSVVETISHFYSFEAANVHRGAHYLSDSATAKFEQARQSIAQFLGASGPEEIVFTKGTTEAINFVAATLGEVVIQAGDEILLTEMEHHANIVPWQMLAKKKNAKLQFVSVLKSGDLDMDDFNKKLSAKTKIFAVTACSNTLGTVNDISKLARKAKEFGAYVVVDGAQYVTFTRVDVQALHCDFFAFSAHKLFGPFGFGAVYAKKEILNTLPPYQGGGSMISTVDWQESTYNISPFRFEAGTPHIEGAIGTKAAIDFYTQIPSQDLRDYKKDLTRYA